MFIEIKTRSKRILINLEHIVYIQELADRVYLYHTGWEYVDDYHGGGNERFEVVSPTYDELKEMLNENRTM